MTENLRQTIDELEAVLRRQVEDVATTKRTINSLCKMIGLDERYADSTPEELTGLRTIRSDQFHGRPLATVITEYMTMRRKVGQSPGSVNEIYDALKAGGYVFDTKNEENAKRSLRASLSKNPKFYKLPGGEYGLREWYPTAKPSKNGSEEEDEEGETDETE
jgi:hypothetical protein